MTLAQMNQAKNNLRLYKYLKKEYARNLMNNGEVYIGTLSYYRDIEDESRADRHEGKKDIVTAIPEPIIITNKEEWNNELPHLKGSNINYESGNVVIEKGEHKGNDEILDAYIYCMSKKKNKELKTKFETDCIIEIFNVQGFLNAIEKELYRLGLIYPNTSSGGEIKYTGHVVSDGNKISGNWLKDSSYEDECEFRFSFIPILHKEGIRLEPIIKNDGSASFPRDVDAIKIEQQTIKLKPKEIQRYCRWT